MLLTKSLLGVCEFFERISYFRFLVHWQPLTVITDNDIVLFMGSLEKIYRIEKTVSQYTFTQWKPLNLFTGNVVFWLVWSNWIKSQIIGYFIIRLTFSLFQCDHIKWLPIWIVINFSSPRQMVEENYQNRSKCLNLWQITLMVESKMSFTVSDFSLAFLTFMSIVKNNLQ